MSKKSVRVRIYTRVLIRAHAREVVPHGKRYRKMDERQNKKSRGPVHEVGKPG